MRSNGKRFWAQVVIDAIPRQPGPVLGFAQLIHDLSEGRAAKEALRRSQEQFRLLVQSVTDHAIYMLDHRGQITNWNLGAQRIKGLPAGRGDRPALLLLLPPKTARPASRPAAWPPPNAKGVSRRKAGGCARTAVASGPTW